MDDHVHKREKRWEGTTVLSWDIGTTNLSYCLIEYVDTPKREYEIHCWENMDLRSEDIKSATDGLRRELMRREWMLNVDHIAIESQTKPNVSTKVISHAIQLYFSIRGEFSVRPMSSIDPTTGFTTTTPANIHFMSATSKFKAASIPEPPNLKPGHQKNKMIAIAMAKHILAANNDTVALNYINDAVKQDDLADSFIQGLVCLRQLRKMRRGTRTRLIIGAPDNADEAIDGTNKEDEHPIRLIYCSDLNFTDGVNRFDIDRRSVYTPTTFKRPQTQP